MTALDPAFSKTEIEAKENHLFTGYVFFSKPMRYRYSKWFIGLDEYPFSKYPPYVTAGAYITSAEVLRDMYYTSMYTKLFRFDDVYLGLVARKAKIAPLHCEHFYYWKKPYDAENYRYVVATHGYGDPDELIQVFKKQKSLGFA